ncbi:hypothetical protein DVH24_028642 [Malus domestica]|uniref:Uncharacterized protein n=1 Tax=Malus domestica TaxID=3750 RepID=A0A498IZK7_MALDO|nr:hypothetical protein DVH24_028642 [Malus domestica]
MVVPTLALAESFNTCTCLGVPNTTSLSLSVVAGNLDFFNCGCIASSARGWMLRSASRREVGGVKLGGLRCTVESAATVDFLAFFNIPNTTFCLPLMAMLLVDFHGLLSSGSRNSFSSCLISSMVVVYQVVRVDM